jgi:cytochrome c oxidase cbb3-type subunit 3
MSVTDPHNDIDAATGRSTTGHEWDGIRELNTPLPRWWLWTFYISIIWSIGYWVVYPAWPLVSGYTAGVLGYSSRSALVQDLAALEDRRGSLAAGLQTKSVDEIAADPQLTQIALARGAASFATNCVPCHGAGGQGGRGYPSLADDDWLWGGSLAEIRTTLEHGIRVSTNPDTRISQMPAYGVLELLQPAEIDAAANYVLWLAKLEPASGADLEKGATIFTEQCAACHGENGQGLKDFGAPALNDAIWLYGASFDQIRAQIHNPRHGVMPGWANRLDDATISALAVYVHNLGGGQ